MPKSRNRKDHKKKVASRNAKIKDEKQKIEKLKREFINELIKQEKDGGKFENNKPINQIDQIDILTSKGPEI